MVKLVLVRHGESEWNLENKFTGWTDVDLSENGVKEAHAAGQLLKKDGYTFDEAFSSVLKRANKTMDIVLGELGESKMRNTTAGVLMSVTMAPFRDSTKPTPRRSGATSRSTSGDAVPPFNLRP
jgi:bisphosphoglycerate-dependent phosphoglycerate mutase